MLVEGTGAPVSASGSIDGRKFHFRSRFLGWTFAVALNDGVDPSTIDSSAGGVHRDDDPDFAVAFEPSGSRHRRVRRSFFTTSGSSVDAARVMELQSPAGALRVRAPTSVTEAARDPVGRPVARRSRGMPPGVREAS